MNKQEFIAKVTPLFIEKGFKTLTVDEIGKAFSMSKKTIYFMFSSKKEIIGLSFQHVLEKFSGFFLHAASKSDNAVEAFFTLLCLINAYFPYDKQRLNIREMEHYYKKLFDAKMEDAHELANTMFKEFCRTGREQGLIRTDFDIEAQSFLFAENYTAVINSSYSGKNENFGKTIMDNVEITIRGVLNNKGIEKFETAKNISRTTDYRKVISDNCL